MLPLALAAVSLLVTYVVIRKGVHHGMLDAHDEMASRDAAKAVRATLRESTDHDPDV